MTTGELGLTAAAGGGSTPALEAEEVEMGRVAVAWGTLWKESC